MAMNGKSQEFTVSAILIQEADGSWSAQCLEYDITAHARTLPDLDYELQSVLASHIAISQELQQEPFSGLGPAPQIFWDMFERAKMRVESVERPFRLPRSPVFPRLTPKLKIAEPQPQLAHA
jgi:hypothetical protein